MATHYIYKTNSLVTAFAVAPTLSDINYKFSIKENIPTLLEGDIILCSKIDPILQINIGLKVKYVDATTNKVTLVKEFETAYGYNVEHLSDRLRNAIEHSDDNTFINISESEYNDIISNIFDSSLKFLIEQSISIKGVDTQNYTLSELGGILSEMYKHAEKGKQVVSIFLFGIKYGKVIISNSYNARQVIEESGLDKSYDVELSKALRLYKCIDENMYGLSFSSSIKNDIDINVTSIPLVQKIYYGAPGTGKSYETKAISANQAHIRTTFHPDSDYSTFVGAYKPTMTKVELRDVTGKVIIEHGEKVTEDKIIYSYVPQSFLQSYTSAWENYPTNQFLIIEEINRGNCAQIFGDLFQLLDRSKNGFSDYPIQADNDIRKYISNYFIENNVAEKISENKETINAIYASKYDNAFERILNGELLVLPSNLSILATMNTSDQSLFPIDSAFKRRWDWVYKPIADAGKGWSIATNGVNYNWWSFIEKINEKIFETTNSEDKKLGYFFVQADNKGVITAERFVGKVIFYLWNDVFKDYGFDDEIFSDSVENNVLTFQKFYGIDGKVSEAILERFLNNLQVNESDDSDIAEE